jgi:hypothetical protein
MIGDAGSNQEERDADASAIPAPATPSPATPPVEIGGRDGPDPVRYGDWEKNGRCIDF